MRTYEHRWFGKPRSCKDRKVKRPILTFTHSMHHIYFIPVVLGITKLTERALSITPRRLLGRNSAHRFILKGTFNKAGDCC